MKDKIKKKSEDVNGFYSFKNITQTSADIYILGEIKADRGWWDDEDDFSQNCLKDFLKTLKDIENVEQLNIYINSPGGEVFSGLNMYNALMRHKAYKTVYIDGMAASAASLVAMSGNKIIMPKNTFIMIHKPWTFAYGNSDELLKVCEMLDSIENGMLNIYEENLKDKNNIEVIKQMVKDETWLDVEEASKYFENIQVSDDLEAVASMTIDINNCENILKSYKNIPDKVKSILEGTPQPEETQKALIIDEIKECIKNVEILTTAKI